jgi:hypothetical protein
MSKEMILPEYANDDLDAFIDGMASLERQKFGPKIDLVEVGLDGSKGIWEERVKDPTTV